MNLPEVQSIITVDPMEETAALEHLKARILRIVPPGSIYMEILQKIHSMEWSIKTDTCSVSCTVKPRMRFNRGFIDEYCGEDHHLLMVMLHELDHVLYGHNMLFPESGIAHNIAFDAVINASLSRKFPFPVQDNFFFRFYDGGLFPEILLYPPADWDNPEPDSFFREVEVTCLSEQLGDIPATRVILLRDKLYNGEDTVSYRDVLDLLLSIAFKKQPVLIGSHGQSDSGAGQGGILRGTDLEDKKTRGKFLQELRKVLVRAGVYTSNPSSPPFLALMEEERQSQSVLPDGHDRTAAAKEQLMGVKPLLYNSNAPTRIPGWTSAPAAHVYLDVSGSMTDDLPWICGALLPLERVGACRLFLFSTEVAPYSGKGNDANGLYTTCGTDVNCVFKHLLDMPPGKQPNKVVLLTDGLFYPPKNSLLGQIKKRCITVHGAITHSGTLDPTQTFARTTTRMPHYK